MAGRYTLGREGRGAGREEREDGGGRDDGNGGPGKGGSRADNWRVE